MPRETAQQNKRTQSKGRGTQSAQNTQNVRSAQSAQNTQAAQSSRNPTMDRQASIQTSRDEGQRSQQSASGQSVQQTNDATRRGMSAPVRGGTTHPFDLMRRMSEDMDRLFEQFGFGRSGFGLAPSAGSLLGSNMADRSSRFAGTDSLWAPQVEVGQRGDRLVVRADLPGIDKDDVHVEVDNDVLTISGERRSEQQDDRDGIFRSERTYGSFYRAIPLPDGVNADQCDAKFNDGVLEISLPLPKQEERSTRRIQIR